jgi:molybdopterin-containing oxidoreductase family iron-sulfur binding subunit
MSTRLPILKEYWRSPEDRAGSTDLDTLHEQESPNGALAAAADDVSRRDFMGIAGFTLASATAALSGCVRKPGEQIVPFAKRPEDLIPGSPVYFATVAQFGTEVLGLLVESQDGRPTKIEGNEKHPGSLGSTNIFAQASVLDLWDGERPKTPRKGGGDSDWAAYDAWAAEHFTAARAAGGKGLALCLDDTRSPTLLRLVQEFRAAYPQAAVYVDDRGLSAREAHSLVGLSGLSGLWDLSKAGRILSVDHDFLGTEGDTVRNSRAFAAGRDIVDGHSGMNRLYSVEAGISVTGMSADHRLRLASSKAGDFLAAVAQVLFAGGVAVPAGAEGFVATLSPQLSVDQQKFAAATAKDLASHQGASAVLVGGRQSAATQALGLLINAALGNVGATLQFVSDKGSVPAAGTLRSLAAAMDAGEVDTLVILGGNPVYGAATTKSFGDLMGRVANTVSFSVGNDETGAAATWSLPSNHFLESWGDLASTDGTVAIQQPLIAPLFDTRSAIEVLAGVIGSSETSGHKLVMATHGTGGEAFERNWKTWLHEGVVAGSTSASVTFAGATSDESGDEAEAPAAAGATWSWGGLESWKSGADVSGSNVEINFALDATMFDGRYANNAWMQEASDPVTKLTWDNAAMMSPKTARGLGIATRTFSDPESEMVRLSIGGTDLEIPAWIAPGLADDVIYVPVGYGRHGAGKVAAGAGFDANPLRAAAGGWFAAGLQVAKSGRKYTLATTQEVGRNDIKLKTPFGDNLGLDFPERPVVREGNYEEFTADMAAMPIPGKQAAGHGDGHGDEHGGGHGEGHVAPEMGSPGMAPFIRKHEVIAAEHIHSLWENEPILTGAQQWGMAIDLTSCTGCGVCTIACQAENNIMVVGKERVLKGREMSWIRIDRYFRGDEDDPEFATQPMACAHCETAPCEAVCPVAATSHSPEGLNDIAYNRCIGTRYCKNNCPFKVRRFNFFNYTRENVEANPVVKMQMNPDVTMRFRGVVEKCSYCVQRINGAKIVAKRDGNGLVPDGAITPACAQACPSKSITFGDINDPSSAVSAAKHRATNYNLLAELNLRTRTSYLGRLRNRNSELS